MKKGMSFEDRNTSPERETTFVNLAYIMSAADLQKLSPFQERCYDLQRETTFVNLAYIMSAADLDEFDLGDEDDEIESKETDRDQGQIQSDTKLEKSNSLEDLVKVSIN